MWKRYNSWTKFHTAAVKRFQKSEFAEARKNAQEAIYSAQVNNRQQEAESLHLLCLIYLEQKDPAALELTKQLIAMSEAVYGTDSLEYATSLELLACSDSDNRQLQEEIIAGLTSAVDIYRRHRIYASALELLEHLVRRYKKMGRNHDAEQAQQKYIKIIKQAHGPRSKQLVQALPNHIAILNDWGKESEAAELEALLDLNCLTCKPSEGNYPLDLSERYAALDSFQNSDPSPEHVQCLKDAVEEFSAWTTLQLQMLDESDDLFKELKILAAEKNLRSAQFRLAELLINSGESTDRQVARELYAELRASNQERRWCTNCRSSIHNPVNGRYYGEYQPDFDPTPYADGFGYEDEDEYEPEDPEDAAFRLQLREEMEERNEREKQREQEEREEMEAREMMRVKLGLNFNPSPRF
jgi:hypothetical protein